jgi:hypothetical protein
MTKEELKKGKKYYYWNKKIGDKQASKKICRLLSILGDMVRVEREDLTVNRIQLISWKRLKEIENEAHPSV